MALKHGRLAATAVLLAGAFGWAGALQAAEVRHGNDEHLKPNGKGWGELDPSGETEKNAAKFSRFSNNGILYHGGPLMLGTPNVYYIWYGDWSGDTAAQTVLNKFGSSIGGTAWYNINSTYYDGSSNHVSNAVHFGPQTNDSYSQGATLNDTAVQNIVGTALTSGALPTDPNGVYFVLTSQDVTETSGFCTQYCAWHTHGTYTSSAGQRYDIKFGFIGNPARCPMACAAQNTTPNGDLAGDSMASLIAHELSESVTDPDLNAWFDQRGQENADKCAWHFGTTSSAGNGSQYNVAFGGTKFLIQQNWVNASGGYCSLHYP